MPRQYRDLTPPSNLSPEEYMKWYYAKMQKYGKDVFARFGIKLPDKFRELTPIERELLSQQVDELAYRLSKETQTKDEDTLAEIGFVSEDQWKEIKSGEYKAEKVFFKLYRGKNYELEFARSIPDILFHILCSGVRYQYYENVFDILIDLMQPVIPTHWKVTLSYVDRITPFYERNRGNDTIVTSSYCIKFNNVCSMPGASEILTKTLNRILANFILPQGM